MTTKPVKDDSQPSHDSDESPLFEGVIFQLDPNMTPSEESKLKQQLLSYGAKCYDDEKNNEQPTHFITDQGKAKDGIISVTPLWVKAAIRNGFTHDPQFYAPDPSKYFSGIVVTASGIPQCDKDWIFGASLALGAQYRFDLAPDVTHLVCLAPEGDLYEEAMGPLYGKYKIILPHWFEECFKLRRLVPDETYLFPDPPLLCRRPISTEISESNIPSDVSPPKEQPDDTENQHPTESPKNMDISEMDPTPTSLQHKNNATDDDDTLLVNRGAIVYTIPNIDVLKTLVPKERFLDGKLIYFHGDVGLSPQMYECLTQLLEMAGATVTDNYDDTLDRSAVFTIFKYRKSKLFRTACNRFGAVVASVPWVTNTLLRGRVESPLQSIYDYPFPYGGINGMENMKATITGYEGNARRILFHICGMVGLPCSGDFDQETTLLICAKRGTDKYKMAKKRNCHIVNHIWLEECYQQWELKSVASQRYTYFPSSDVLQCLVGQTPLTEAILKPWFDEDTCPATTEFVPMHILHHSLTPTTPDTAGTPDDHPNDNSGSARRPRQAAVSASSHLRDVYIPDMNDYQKEQRSGNNHQNSTTSTTDTATKKHQRRLSVTPTSSSDISSPAAKRSKLTHMKSMDNSLKDVIPPLPLPPQAIESSENITSHKSATTPPKPTKKKQLTKDKETKNTTLPTPTLADNNGMEGVTLSADSKQQLSTSSQFIFLNNPSKIATTQCELTKDDKTAIKRLGGALVDDIRKADILVVPKKILRTPKFLCAVNLGMTIVTEQWLRDSITNHAWCNTSEYQVEDLAMEKSHGFNLFDSLLSAQQSNQQHGKSGKHGNWLQGYEICVLPSAGSEKTFKDVVETGGGKIIQVPKRRSQNNTDHTNSILALADKDDQKRKRWSDVFEHGIKIYDKEMIIIGALRQKLELDEFYLA